MARIILGMAEPRWLDDDEQHAWRSYLRMAGKLSAHLNRQLQADSDLSLADFDVLVHLTDVPERRLRVVELARELEWEKSRLSHHVARMERRGLVRREECEDDGRGSYIVLTPTGLAAIEAAAPGHVETVRQAVFDGLSREQVTALGQVADQVLARLGHAPARAVPASAR
jgi:DNA-binding MarR family transcriptional regulator